MADLHGQPLVTILQPNERIAAGQPGQTGADNIQFSDLKTQVISPVTGSAFAADVDLSQIQGTYYNAITQSANISFNFVNATDGGTAFIRITANGTNTFTFTSIESFGVTSGQSLPSGSYVFRFQQTPYGVSVAVFREISPLIQTASNGLTPVNNDVRLGGPLAGDTVVNGLGTHSFSCVLLNSFTVIVSNQIRLNHSSVGELDISTANGIILSDLRATKRGMEVDFTDYTGLTNNSFIPKGHVFDLLVGEEKTLSTTSVDMSVDSRNFLSRNVTGNENITITNPLAGRKFVIIATGGTGITVNSQTPTGDAYSPGVDNVIDVRCVRTSPVKYIVTNIAG